MKKNRAFSFKYFLFDFIRITGFPLLIWFRPKKYYLRKEDKQKIKGGALIICNHITMFDPIYLFLLIKSRRQHFICMDELIHNKFQRWMYTRAFLCIPINRNNISITEVKTIISNLKSGNVVTMFPEGHVNDSKEGMQNFKSGMVMMAMRGNVPIIPVYMKRRKHFLSRLEAAVGAPIDLNQFKENDYASKENIWKACAYIEEKEKELEAFMLLKGKKQ